MEWMVVVHQGPTNASSWRTMRSVSPHTKCSATRNAGKLARWPLISMTYSALESSWRNRARGTQNVAATSSLGTNETLGSTRATNGRKMIGGREADTAREPTVPNIYPTDYLSDQTHKGPQEIAKLLFEFP